MSFEIIEIIGPPGIGKTTFYNALCKNWRGSLKWTYQNALLSPAPLFSDLSNWLMFRAKKLFNKDLYKSVPLEFGLRFTQSYPELVNFCWKQLSDENVFPDEMAGLRFRSVFLLYLDFCRYQAITEKGSSITCLLNEGLLQKSFLNQGNVNLLPDLINTYLSLVPLPKGIICLNTEDSGLVVERLLNRPKIIASHLGKSRNALLEDIIKWQFQLRLINSWMLNHHVKVYNLDGAKSVKENVLIMTEILEQQKYADPYPSVSQCLNDTADQQIAVN